MIGIRSTAVAATDTVARLMCRAGLTPNAMTVVGMTISLVGAVGFLALGHLITAVVIIAVGSLCDAVDGAMARIRGRTSPFGALLDSTADRVSDGAIFAALAYWLLATGRERAGAIALVCGVAAQLVSYTRARAEGLGRSAEIGLAQRSLRLCVVGFGVLCGAAGLFWAMEAVLVVLAVLTLVTAAQRVAYVRRQLRDDGR